MGKINEKLCFILDKLDMVVKPQKGAIKQAVGYIAFIEVGEVWVGGMSLGVINLHMMFKASTVHGTLWRVRRGR